MERREREGKETNKRGKLRGDTEDEKNKEQERKRLKKREETERSGKRR